MVCFQKVFVETTDPNTDYNRLMNMDVVASIIFHSVSYIILVYLFAFIFNFKISRSSYLKLFIFLIRLGRSKSLRQVFINKGLHEDDARIHAMELIHKGYFTYYFLA
jgi:hypothetical protein